MFIISYCLKILLIDWYKNAQRLYFCVPYWTVIEPKYLKHPTFLFFLYIQALGHRRFPPFPPESHVIL